MFLSSSTLIPLFRLPRRRAALFDLRGEPAAA
jgi:hypothetical protein